MKLVHLERFEFQKVSLLSSGCRYRWNEKKTRHPGIFHFFTFASLILYYSTMANEIKVILYMTGILATGYGLMKYTVPDEEAMRKVSL